jgi:hypothetical protein
LNALKLEGFYYRSIRGKSYKYSKLAGGWFYGTQSR